jgi:hypothetical protein
VREAVRVAVMLTLKLAEGISSIVYKPTPNASEHRKQRGPYHRTGKCRKQIHRIYRLNLTAYHAQPMLQT